jgi:hypothetical protein
MSAFALILLIASVIATGAFYVAGDLSMQGSQWAVQVCRSAHMLCDHPLWSAMASAGLAFLYIILRMAGL